MFERDQKVVEFHLMRCLIFFNFFPLFQKQNRRNVPRFL